MEYRAIFIFVLAAIRFNCIFAQSPYAYTGDSSVTLQPSGHDKPHCVSVIRADADNITSIIHTDFKLGIIRLYSSDGKYLNSDTIDTNRKAFTSVDPHAENYYHMSPYTYCGGNPVNAIDPNGRDWYYNNQTSYYTWYDGDRARDGFTHIGGKGSILGEEFESVLNDVLCGKDGLGLESIYSNGFTFDIAPVDKGGLIGSKERGWDFFDEFVYGYGPEFSVLLENHPYTQAIMKDSFAMDSQNTVRTRGCNGKYTNVRRPEFFPWQASPLSPMQFIGTYRYDGYSSKNNKIIYNIATDSKSVTSLGYHIPFLRNHRGSHQKEFGNTYQFYLWRSPR